MSSMGIPGGEEDSLEVAAKEDRAKLGAALIEGVSRLRPDETRAARSSLHSSAPLSASGGSTVRGVHARWRVGVVNEPQNESSWGDVVKLGRR
jgi:hypothetical protein